MVPTRWQRLMKQQIITRLSPGVAVFLAAVLLTAAIWVGVSSREVVPVSVPVASDKPVFSLFFPKWSDVLVGGIPRLTQVVNGQQPAKPVATFSWQQWLRAAIKSLTHVDVGDMRSVLRNQIPLLSAVKAPGIKGNSQIKRPILQFKPKTVSPVTKPLVAIYHTHTSESFVPTTGVTHRRGGQVGEIVAVGEALVQQLNKYQVQAVHSKQVHDFPSFMKAYGPSELTAKKLLADHPSVQIVLDIHRDAETRENSLAEVNGVSVARIAAIVAVGQEDLVQPHWQKNLAFAKQIDDKMNAYFPGLSRGIQTVEWRYNQHLHERALLFEVGSQETSQEEAERAMEILGGILVEILSENKNFGVQ
ncbi:MAG: stage sporulation protein [Anaerosporomusa subterranea]|jgi:stage II sporulation protein P|nr:stage sporulation protein [Anaerosporomusa subterranea]